MAQRKEGGLVHLYIGDGKGKPTAAVGLMVRALGHGFRMMLVQFFNDGQSGEIKALRVWPVVEILAGQVTDKFLRAMSAEGKAATRALHLQFFQTAEKRAMDGAIDLLVLDEVLDAVMCGTLGEPLLLDFLDRRPAELEVLMTGRSASDALFCRADYISRVECVRHPYDRGILAREGIEY